MTKCKELEDRMRALYKTYKSTYCPCLKQNIHYNSKGFYHLKYDGTNAKRTNKEKEYRMKLIPLAPSVIRMAKNIDTYTPMKYLKNMNKYVEFWSLKTEVGKQKVVIKVILRRIGNGNITFFSVMKINNKNAKQKKLT